MDINNVVIDFDLEEEGIWFPYDHETDVKVASISCNSYKKVMKRIMKPYRRKIKMNTLDPDLFEKLLSQALAEGVVREWRGMYNNGEKVPFSKAKAVEYMTMPKMRDFKEFVAECADDVEAFRMEEIEEEAGNLQTG